MSFPTSSYAIKVTRVCSFPYTWVASYKTKEIYPLTRTVAVSISQFLDNFIVKPLHKITGHLLNKGTLVNQL